MISICLFLVGSILLVAQRPYDSVNNLFWDFEDGTLQGFTKDSGDCGTMPQRYDTGSGNGKSEAKAWSGGGNYHFNTYNQNDGHQCVYSARDKPFMIQSQTRISWCGTAGCG